MQLKTTVILLVLFVLMASFLGGYWYYQQASGPGEVDTAEIPSDNAISYVFEPRLKTNEIHRISISQPGQDEIVFEADSDADSTSGQTTWRMTAPINVPTESYPVRTLLSAIHGLQSRAAFEPGADNQPTAADAGLETPVATVTITGPGDKKNVLEIGGPVVMSSDCYVRVGDQSRIYVATRDLRPLVRKPLNDYRAKGLLDLRLDNAVALKVEHAGATYAFTRTDDGEWVIDAPIKAHADRGKVRDLITKIRNLRATDFAENTPRSLAPYQLSTPEYIFTIKTETRVEIPSAESADTQPAKPAYRTTEATHTLLLGGTSQLKPDLRYVKLGDQPWIAMIEDSATEDLVPKLKELRDPRVMRVNSGDITAVTLTVGGNTATVSKTGETWTGAGDLEALDVPAFRGLLDAIQDLEAVDYITSPESPEAYGLATPRATLVIAAAGQVEPLTLYVGDDIDRGRSAYAQRAGDPTVIVVRAAQAQRLAPPILSLRSRQMLDYPVDAIQTIRMTRSNARYELNRDEDMWNLAAPQDAPINRDAAGMLARELATLRAGTVVAKTLEPHFNLDSPGTLIEVDVVLPGEGAGPAAMITRSIRLGRDEGGVTYALLDDQPYVYELLDTTYEVISAELIDTRIFMLNAEMVIRLKVETPDETLEFAKGLDGWQYPPDPYVELDQSKITALIESLVQFRADAYLQYTGADLDAEGLTASPYRVTIGLAGGSAVGLHLVPEQNGQSPPLKAGLIGAGRVLRMQPADIESLLRGLDYYVVIDEK